MSRTRRQGGKARDGDKHGTMRGLDKCPPKEFRAATVHRPARAEDRRLEALASRLRDPDELPAHGRPHMPWFT